jgi:hypothetical protein
MRLRNKKARPEGLASIPTTEEEKGCWNLAHAVAGFGFL